MILNRLNLSTKSAIYSLLMLYIVGLCAVSAIAGIALFLGVSDGIKNQVLAVGLWGLAVGFAYILLKAWRAQLDIYAWGQAFVDSRIIRPVILIACIVQLMIYVFATSLDDANTPLVIYQWGVMVSLLTLATDALLRLHFVPQIDAASSDITNQQLLQITIIAGILGFIIGYLHPNLQVGVEQGQVLSGIIPYDMNNPWYMYQAKLWNFWAQFSAFGLSLGVSEITLSLIVSGMAGMLFSIGVAIIGFVVSRQRMMALMLPFLVLLCLGDGGLLDRIQDGYGYPLMLVGFHHTYGMLGMSYMMLVVSIMLAGKHRLGFFLLGFSLMIHPSLSIWLHLTLLIYVLYDFRNLIDWIKKGLFVIIGYGVSIGSLVLQRLSFPIPPLPAGTEQQYLDAVTRNFATHGGYDLILDTVEGRFLVMVFIICLGLLMLSRLRPSLQLGFKLIMISMGVGVLGNLFAHMDHYLADMVTVLLPNRFLNMAPYLFVPMVIAGGLAVIYQSINARNERITSMVTGGLAVVVIGLSLTVFVQRYGDVYQVNMGQFDTPVYQATRETEGLLLVSPSERGFHTTMIQMLSNRPLVLNPLALDSLPYTVEAGPATATILDEIYGVDFYDAPHFLATARSGQNPTIDDLWEHRTADEWQALAEAFGFTQVLVHRGIDLQLPIVAQNEDGITLYQVSK